MFDGNHAAALVRYHLAQQRALRIFARRPGIAEPNCRKHMQLRSLRTAIAHLDLDQHVLGRSFGILDEYIEITIIVEHTRVEQLEFHFGASASCVAFDDLIVGICILRVFVQILKIGMGRRRIEIEVVFLDIFAMIAFAVGKSEQTLLEDRVLAVPKGERKAK